MENRERRRERERERGSEDVDEIEIRALVQPTTVVECIPAQQKIEIARQRYDSDQPSLASSIHYD
jgi:hypothetical protein